MHRKPIPRPARAPPRGAPSHSSPHGRIHPQNLSSRSFPQKPATRLPTTVPSAAHSSWLEPFSLTSLSRSSTDAERPDRCRGPSRPAFRPRPRLPAHSGRSALAAGVMVATSVAGATPDCDFFSPKYEPNPAGSNCLAPVCRARPHSSPGAHLPTAVPPRRERKPHRGAGDSPHSTTGWPRDDCGVDPRVGTGVIRRQDARV